jgi:nitroreductase
MTSTIALLSPSDVRWLVAQATRAPSIHNTQPWRFRWDGHAFELRADTVRGLGAADPEGRELVLSCGSALFNLRLALAKLGLDAEVTLLPRGGEPRLFARVAVRPGTPADAGTRRMYAAMTRRHTHRGVFEDRPLSAELAVHLQQAAEEEGASLLYVHDPGQRHRVLHLARAAERQLAADERVRAEVAEWTPPPMSDRRDGIPASAYAREPSSLVDDLPARDFDLGRGFGQAESVEHPPGGLAVLLTVRDLEVDWLQAGQALERVLVTAAERSAFAAMHSQVIEVPNLRDELRRELCTAFYPQILLRFGYSADVQLTPRRPVDDVLELA